MRIALISALIVSVSVGEALGQTSAPVGAPSAPAAATPAPAAPVAPGAPPSGAPAFGPTPGTPGVALPPSPSINSAPSQSNVDLYPPSRLTTPGGPAGPPTPGQVSPGTSPLGQTPQGSGTRPQPGGASTTAPAKMPRKTGNDYSVADCMGIWDAGAHMTKGQWRTACMRVQNRLDNIEALVAQETNKTNRKRQSGLGVDRSPAN